MVDFHGIYGTNHHGKIVKWLVFKNTFDQYTCIEHFNIIKYIYIYTGKEISNVKNYELKYV